MSNQAKVFLIPNTLGAEASIEKSFPPANKEVISSLEHFAVENLKDARRFLVRMGLKHKIDESQFYILNKRTDTTSIQPLIAVLKSGSSVGILSDAGCPGIADPGSVLVEAAHHNNIQVDPLIGPSSILLALIASGFNGQSFTFKGYLNREKTIRIKELKEMEAVSFKKKETQIFMETPYRNEALWEDLLHQLNPSTKVCIAANLSLDTAYIKTKSVAEWRKTGKKNIHKIPAIFVLSA